MTDILLIKSSSRAYPKVKSALREEYPGAKIDVLVTSEPGQVVEAEPEQGESIRVDEGKFELSALTSEELEELRETGYDLVVVLYNDIYEFGYGNVEKLARNLEAAAVESRDLYGRGWRLGIFNRFFLFWLRLFKKPAVFFLDLLTILFILVYFIPALLWRYLKGTSNN